MKIKLYLSTTLAAFAIATAACGGAATTTETTKTNATGGNTPKVETQKQTAAIKMSTPTEANESLFTAIKNKDKAAVKQLMSKGSLEILEAAAKEKKLTLDEVLDKEFFANVTLPAKLEQRNEKINGDKATVEMLTDKDEWTPSNFVKEGTAWKADLMS